MDKLIVRALTFKADRRAVTALEYGIIAGMMGIILVTVFKTLGTQLSAVINTVATSI